MPIHPAEAAGLLAYAAATDNREVTETAAHAWAAALDDKVTPRDGKAAIDAHRSTSTDWLMPAHINAEVRRIRRARLDGMETPQPPEALDGIPAREPFPGRPHMTLSSLTPAAADALTALAESSEHGEHGSTLNAYAVGGGALAALLLLLWITTRLNRDR